MASFPKASISAALGPRAIEHEFVCLHGASRQSNMGVNHTECQLYRQYTYVQSSSNSTRREHRLLTWRGTTGVNGIHPLSVALLNGTRPEYTRYQCFSSTSTNGFQLSLPLTSLPPVSHRLPVPSEPVQDFLCSGVCSA